MGKSKDRQYNSQKKKDKTKNNGLQITAQKSTIRATRTLQNPVKNVGASERLAVPAPLVTPVVLTVFRIWKILILLKRVWKYQKGNQNPYIEEEQTIQWPKEKVQKDKQIE